MEESITSTIQPGSSRVCWCFAVWWNPDAKTQLVKTKNNPFIGRIVNGTKGAPNSWKIPRIEVKGKKIAVSSQVRLPAKCPNSPEPKSNHSGRGRVYVCGWGEGGAWWAFRRKKKLSEERSPKFMKQRVLQLYHYDDETIRHWGAGAEALKTQLTQIGHTCKCPQRSPRPPVRQKREQNTKEKPRTKTGPDRADWIQGLKMISPLFHPVPVPGYYSYNYGILHTWRPHSDPPAPMSLCMLPSAPGLHFCFVQPERFTPRCPCCLQVSLILQASVCEMECAVTCSVATGNSPQPLWISLLTRI